MNKAYLCIIAGASLWGLIGLFVKSLALQGFSSMQIVALRGICSSICITLFLLLTRPSALKLQLKDLWMFVGTGVLSLTFFNYCYFKCIDTSSLAVAALLLYTAPVFVMLMSLVLFKEAFTKIKGLAMLCAILGCALVTGAATGKLLLSPQGLLYGLGSGFGYALYSIFGKYALERYDSYTITAFTFYFSMLSSVPLAGFSQMPALSSGNWVNIIGLSLLSTILPYLLYTKGLAGVEAGKASILATIEPFVAATVGVVVFAEPLSLSKVIGMLLIFIAVVALNKK